MIRSFVQITLFRCAKELDTAQQSSPMTSHSVHRRQNIRHY